jgi:hypothetical protein
VGDLDAGGFTDDGIEWVVSQVFWKVWWIGFLQRQFFVPTSLGKENMISLWFADSSGFRVTWHSEREVRWVGLSPWIYPAPALASCYVISL